MKLPFRNYLATPLIILIEPDCEQYEIAAGGEGVVTLDDGHPHSIEVYPDQRITIWNEGPRPAAVELRGQDQSSYPRRRLVD